MRRPVHGFLLLAGAAGAVFACASESNAPSPSPRPIETAAPAASAPPIVAPPPPACATAGLPPGVTVNQATVVLACDGPAAELALTTFADGTARLRYGKDARGSIVSLDRPPEQVPSLGHRDADLVVCSPELEVTITPGSCRVKAIDVASGQVVLDDGPSGGFFSTQETLPGETSPRPAIGVARQLAAGERVYGLGLHTGARAGLDLRGRTIELWNTDAFDAAAGGFRPDAPSLYESIPFYIGLRDKAAYGVFTDNTFRTRFDLGATDPTRARVIAFGGAIDQWIFAGPSLADVVRRYTRLTGRAPLPPRWALGFHQSRWEGPCDGAPSDRPFCSANQVRALAKRLRDEKIPADGIFLDIQHMDGFRTFTFDRARFADPTKLFDDLRALGYVTHTIVDPGIKIDSAYSVYQSGLAGDHFLKTAAGTPFEGEVWPGPSVFPDFSAPATRAWWSGLVEGAAKTGVTGMWIDMNEPSSFVGGTVPSSLAASGDGRATSMEEVHNAYAYFEAKATVDGLVKARPGERPFVLSRAAFAGQQRYSAVWTGDAPSTWETLGMTLPQLLSLGLSGMPFAGSDVGGYSGRSESTAELFSRWMATGAISPFFRAHAEKDARRQEPWSFGEDVLGAVRSLIELRYELMPYLYGLFAEAARTGAPVLRPLVYDFQDDPRTHDVGDQAMLGPWLMVAPPVAASATTQGRRVVLPPGRWFELRSGAVYDGGQDIVIKTDPEPLPGAALPIFAREGAIVFWTKSAATTTAQLGGPLFVDVFPAATASKWTLYEDDGALAPASSRVELEAVRTAAGARVTASARVGTYVSKHERFVVRIRRADRGVVSVKLGGVALDQAASVEQAMVTPAASFAYDASDRTIVVSLLDLSPPFDLDLEYDATPEPNGEVDVPIVVDLPPGTPAGTPIHVASSASGWTHAALTRTGDRATGTVRAPRGAWFFFKITRGGWTTVERNASCLDRPNRYALAAARSVFATVARWADACP